MHSARCGIKFEQIRGDSQLRSDRGTTNETLPKQRDINNIVEDLKLFLRVITYQYVRSGESQVKHALCISIASMVNTDGNGTLPEDDVEPPGGGSPPGDCI